MPAFRRSWLSAGEYAFRMMPESLSRLSRLRELVLDACGVHGFSRSLAQMTNLESLTVPHSQPYAAERTPLSGHWTRWAVTPPLFLYLTTFIGRKKSQISKTCRQSWHIALCSGCMECILPAEITVDNVCENLLRGTEKLEACFVLSR